MQRFVIIALCGTLFFFLSQQPAGAISVNLILYNSNELIDLNTSTPLAGSSDGGYLVEILWAGPNAAIDPLVTPSFLPGGDDEMLRDTDGMIIGITHVGTGMPDSISNGYVELFLPAVDYDYYASQGSTKLYVRFYNVYDPQITRQQGGEVWWGESDLFDIPAPDFFYLSELDFAPSYSLTTYNMVNIPEPLSWILLFTAGGAFIYARKRRV